MIYQSQKKTTTITTPTDTQNNNILIKVSSLIFIAQIVQYKYSSESQRAQNLLVSPYSEFDFL